MTDNATTHDAGTQKPGQDQPILELRDLVKDFKVGTFLSRDTVRALAGVNVELRKGEILAVVGESGSGKSTIARCIARLEQPTSGEILLNGTDILKAEPKAASRSYRSQVQMVFQDPFGSLNPVHSIQYFLARPLEIFGNVPRGKLRERCAELLAQVELPEDFLDAYPHELSGGQRQRIAIARALAVDPSVILADEPTSMLDVSVRIGILNLMRCLRDEKGISMLYITHDLASARYVADRTMVMFAGELVEAGDSMELMAEPAHPYTQLLLSAVPDPERTGTYDPVERARLRRLVLASPSCPYNEGCSSTTPTRHQVGANHWVRCHLNRPQAAIAERLLGSLNAADEAKAG